MSQREGVSGHSGKTFVQGQVRGVKVLDVFPGSPAARAGLRSDRDRIQSAGHVIIGVDGQAVRSEEELAQIMARLSAGAQVQLFLTNAMGKTSEVISVVLGTAPEALQTPRVQLWMAPVSLPHRRPYCPGLVPVLRVAQVISG